MKYASLCMTFTHRAKTLTSLITSSQGKVTSPGIKYSSWSCKVIITIICLRRCISSMVDRCGRNSNWIYIDPYESKNAPACNVIGLCKTCLLISNILRLIWLYECIQHFFPCYFTLQLDLNASILRSPLSQQIMQK